MLQLQESKKINKIKEYIHIQGFGQFTVKDSVAVRLFLLTVCCLCSCTLYAQALSTPCPSIMQGFQSGKGKRPATTKASSGSSASNFSCNNESCKHKRKAKITAILNNNVHKNYLMPANNPLYHIYFYPMLDEPKIFFILYFPIINSSQLMYMFTILLTTLGAKNTVTFLHFVKSTCDEIKRRI